MRATIALAVILSGLAAVPAAADWLVLRDGTRLETRGAWTQKGRLVVFTSAEGRLSSLRSEAVDLAASRRATAEAHEAAARPAAPEAPPAEETRPVRRITNADIPAGQPAPAREAVAASGEAAAAAEPAAGALQVRDTAQRTDPIDDHLVVTGSLANTSQRTAAAIDLAVHAYGADGEVLATQSANLALAALRPGASTAFEAHFRDVYAVAMALRFAPSATFLETGPQERAEPAAGEPEGGP